MAQVINSNILSLTAQRNLNKSGGALATSLERLSSGLRINSAKDDAAGLAISERFTTQIRGLNQAIRNANDGISLAQTAEGALGEVSANLQRIRELAVQSVNATNSDTDRATLDQEVQQRFSEIDRIASQTSFNGRNVLDGSFGSALFQVGANVGETIGLDLNTSMRTSAVGAVATATSVDLSTIIAPAVTAVTGSAATATFDLSGLLGTNYSTAATAGTFTGTVAVPAGFTYSNANSLDFSVTVDGGSAQAIALDETSGIANDGVHADAAAIITEINSQLTGATASISGGNLLITSDTTGTSSTVAISGVAALGTATNLFTGGASTAGAAATAITLTIGDPGDPDVTVTLNADLSTGTTAQQSDALLAEIVGALAVTPEFSATDNDAGVITLTDATSTTGSFTLTNGATPVTATTSTAGVTAVTGVAALSLTLAADELTVQFGDNPAISVGASTYTTVQSLVDAVNLALGSNGTASLDSTTNVMSITSGDAITIGGAEATTVFTATSFATSGSLDDADVLTVAGANATIQRIDAALTAASDLRSTFGAIQNRFESTIANLTGTAENLTASRSRIQDADFAAETAALTRAQILQQAGISVLAQANAQPQNVLALLN